MKLIVSIPDLCNLTYFDLLVFLLFGIADFVDTLICFWCAMVFRALNADLTQTSLSLSESNDSTGGSFCVEGPGLGSTCKLTNDVEIDLLGFLLFGFFF